MTTQGRNSFSSVDRQIPALDRFGRLKVPGNQVEMQSSPDVLSQVIATISSSDDAATWVWLVVFLPTSSARILLVVVRLSDAGISFQS
jgi:hypothetical protein